MCARHDKALAFHPWAYPVFILLSVLLALFVGGILDKEALDMEQAQYCRMVAMHQADPSIGWPDYNQSFDGECEPDGRVRHGATN